MKQEKKLRVLLVSDMHYSTEETHEEMKKLHPEVNTSIAAGDAMGHTQYQKVQRVLSDILAENEKEKIDLVLVLGDLSIDDYNSRNLPGNWCEKFRDECMKHLPCPCFAIPGNHDSYPDGMWKDSFGYGRQYSVEKDGNLFIMLDTFANCPAKDASGSGYSGVDTAFLTEELKKHPGMPTFLCSHYFAYERESEEFRRIVKENPDIVCLFQGHTHHQGILPLGEDYGGKLLFDIGGYGYDMSKFEEKWTFCVFRPASAWGYDMLEIYEDHVKRWHRKPNVVYRALNGTFNFPDSIWGEVEIPLEK